MATILVVDDEVMIRANLEAFLEDEGYKVESAEDGHSALALLEKTPVDLAIVDIRLPDMDGNSVIAQARVLQPGLPILIHTGSSEYMIPPELNLLGLGPEHIIHKPLTDLSKLTRALKENL